MNWSGSKLLRPTIQICVLMLSWYTGLSRVSVPTTNITGSILIIKLQIYFTYIINQWDLLCRLVLVYRSDVLSGFLIGAIAASLTVSFKFTTDDC